MTTSSRAEPITHSRIRPLGLADLAHCLALTDEAGWPYSPQRWSFLASVGDLYGIDAPDGGLAGAVLLTRYDANLAAIGTMLVARRYQRQRLGTALMRHAIAAADGSPVLLYATENGRPLYEKLGFTAVTTVGTLIGRFTPAPTTATAQANTGAGAATEAEAEAKAGVEVAASTRTRPATAADLPAIAALDAKAIGADRTPVLQRLLDTAEHVIVLTSGPEVTGYAAALRNPGNLVIGPVIAATEADARTLITDLAGTEPGPIRVEIDHARPGQLAWAGERGLSEVTFNTLMVHGRSLPGDRARLHAPILTALG